MLHQHLDQLFHGLKEKYPTSEIYFVLPIHRSDEDGNVIGLSLKEYREAIKIKAEKHKIPTIDGFEIPIDPRIAEHRKLYSKDGVHINSDGHRIYGEYVYEKILELRKGQRK